MDRAALTLGPGMDMPIMHESDRYDFVRDIGSGNFGVARLMRDKQTKELVAVKYIERGDKVSFVISQFVPPARPPHPKSSYFLLNLKKQLLTIVWCKYGNFIVLLFLESYGNIFLPYMTKLVDVLLFFWITLFLLFLESFYIH